MTPHVGSASSGARPASSSIGHSARGALIRSSRLRGKNDGVAPSAQSKARDDTDGQTQEDTGGFLGGIFGTGTQRVKAKRQEAAKGGTQKKKLSSPSGGTKKLNGAQSKKKGGLFGTKSTRGARKDPNTVFVAGSTGRIGLRIVRQLLLAGFKVRAGARNLDKAQSYAKLAEEFGIVGSDAIKRLQIVPVDLEDTSTIVDAIGNAGRVVQAIGAAEDNVLDFGAPKRIDGSAAISLINAAVETGIDQYVMISSLGTGKFGWPAGALNLFGGILFQKRRAEKALEDSGLQYVIVRPGGMEKPTDDYKLTHNVRLSTRDTLFGGLVSRLQVAELVNAAISDPSLAENKVLEVVAEEEAPLLEYEQLLQQHPSEITQEERNRQKQFQQDSRSRVASAEAELEDASAAFSEAQDVVKQLKDALKEKRTAISSAERDLAPVIDEADQLAAELARLKAETEENSQRQEAAKAVLNAAKAAKREGRKLSEQEIASIEDPILRETTAAEPKKKKRGASRQQEGIAEGIAQKELNLGLGKDGKGSKEDQALAEGISQKEIDMSLRKAGPEPSAQEKGLAEGIAQKEIAIDTGKDESTRSWFGGKKAKPKPSPKLQASEASMSSKAAPTEKSEPVTQDSQLKREKAPKPSKPEVSAEELEERKEARNKSTQARADKEATFLRLLEDQQKEALTKKAQAAEKRAGDARKKSAEETRARLLKLVGDESEVPAKPAYKNAPKKRPAAKRSAPAPVAEKKPETEEKKEAELKKKGAQVPEEKEVPVPAKDDPTPQTIASTDQALQQAKANAKEARQWIDEWRAEQRPATPSAASNGSTPSASSGAPTAQDNGSEPTEFADNGKAENAKEARQWIEDWRERSKALK